MLPCMYCGCRAGYTCLPTYLSTKVHFYASGRNEGEIAGAFVENYLLEKSRVVGACAAGRSYTYYDFYTSTTYYGHTDSPGKSQQGERSYHIFYQLAISQIWAPALSLQPAEAYRYLASCTTVPSIDDAADFEEVSTAFTAMGFSGDDVQVSKHISREVSRCRAS